MCLTQIVYDSCMGATNDHMVAISWEAQQVITHESGKCESHVFIYHHSWKWQVWHDAQSLLFALHAG